MISTHITSLNDVVYIPTYRERRRMRFTCKSSYAHIFITDRCRCGGIYTNPYAAIRNANDTGTLLYTVLPTFRTALRTSQAAVPIPCKRRSSKFVNKLNCVYDTRRRRVCSLLRWRWRVDTTLVGDA